MFDNMPTAVEQEKSESKEKQKTEKWKEEEASSGQ